MPPNNGATDSRTGCTICKEGLPRRPLPINIDLVPINNRTPTDAKVWEAAQKLMNGRAPGASRMHAKYEKQWLNRMRLEEDPKSGTGNENAGDNWHLFLKLAQAVWDHGDITPQLPWVIVVLILKGGGDYQGIGLLEPMWKVCEHVMDTQLNRTPSTRAYMAVTMDAALAQL